MLANSASALNVLTDGLLEKLDVANWQSDDQQEWSSQLKSVIDQHRTAVLAQHSPDAIQAMTIKGRYLTKDNAYAFTVLKMRPHYFRLDLETPDGVMIQAYDGDRGWFVPVGADPQTGAKWMDRQANAGMARDALILDYMLESESEPASFSMINASNNTSGEIGIEVKLSNGSVINYWLDPETYLTTREIKTDYEDGGFKFRTVRLSDYQDIDGIKLAHKAQHYLSGELESELIIEEIDLVDSHSPILFAAPILETPHTSPLTPSPELLND
ncbi:hypothetical protein [Cerasicoccus arenae]|uniref:Outer membrane lipoprotein-sorting protein n=1 Tax=Cerasicoccus arenae TaxID=424488 RepID=A0A8J3DC53_9BACT|nr:hypothetical protein [Cerasicoccus arenae]MBK1858950.1 hypothetical protein [Cerasicoccus arenae]GHC04039.1 hypothetical protein GCM10007047_20850 [Cerasicoccus arenae]